MTAAPFMAPLFAGFFFARALLSLEPGTIPVGASLLAMALCQAMSVLQVYISIAAVTAAIGSAFTASPFKVFV